MSTANQERAALAHSDCCTLPPERVVKAPSAVVTCARVIRSGDAS